MCGVRMTFVEAAQGREEFVAAFAAGSAGNTSTAAPRRCPSRTAAASASTSTTVPRVALIRNAPGPHRADLGPADHAVRVARVSGTWRLTTSLAPAARRGWRRLGVAERQLVGGS